MRNLKRELASVLRHIACQVVTQNLAQDQKQIHIDEHIVYKALGPPKVFIHDYQALNPIGTALGLAWTPVGGEVLSLESRSMVGKGKMTLTGKLGEVMQESAQTARSLVRAYVQQSLPDFFTDHDIHVHIPSGAIPKDGPSAGVTLSIALMSLAIEQPVKAGFAMTGEITLNGKVLPVGGIKEKVMAAAKHQLRHIIVPWQNQVDLEKIPEQLKKDLHFYPIQDIQEAFDLLFETHENG